MFHLFNMKSVLVEFCKMYDLPHWFAHPIVYNNIKNKKNLDNPELHALLSNNGNVNGLRHMHRSLTMPWQICMALSGVTWISTPTTFFVI